MPTLYVVGTPIGNLEDITLRALRILKEVDAILCEDTRVTSKILSKYEIRKTLIRYDAHSTQNTLKNIFALVEEGKSLALVTDAGTPGISDPGSHLVAELRKQFNQNELDIVAVPGPSAVVAALSISGLPASDFLFLGFLPHKKGRETLFKEIAESSRTVVFYESTHRIIKTLESLIKHLEGSRKIVVGRELTKIHEEVYEGTAEETRQYFLKTPIKQKGEFVLMVRGN